jgi:DNA-binding response OmpR family regulator
LLRRGLSREGHEVTLMPDGPKGIEAAKKDAFDIILLDIMLPGLDGLAVARRLRGSGVRTPILMLTARDSVSDIVRGLDVGADDYLTKPFSFDVLAARLRAIGRRSAQESAPLLHVGDLTLNVETHEVHRGGKQIALTPTEYTILEHLMKRAGRVVSRDSLIEAVWGMNREVGHNAVDVFVFQLRSKIEGGSSGRLIQTVRGFGYTVRETEAE